MTTKTLDQNIKLFARTINIEIGTPTYILVKLFDDSFDSKKDPLKQKALAQKEYNDVVVEKDSGLTGKIEKKFTIRKLAQELGVDPEKVKYIGGWIDIVESEEEIIREYEKEVLLKVEEPEEKITIIVELPHSKETGWGAKGLAGHTAMAIGDSFFDYGPDYDRLGVKSFNEKEYQADLNQDGDMEDILKISEIESSFYFAPGRPWWGEILGNTLSKNANEVTLQEALQLINLPYKQTNIYGTVYKIEFYVKKSQADKMIEWWKDRYKHLKIYSVKPWKGEQCTTTVKEALAYGEITDIDWNTLTPDGILKDLDTEIKSTSFQHKNKPAKVTLIKKEAIDWKP